MTALVRARRDCGGFAKQLGWEFSSSLGAAPWGKIDPVCSGGDRIAFAWRRGRVAEKVETMRGDTMATVGKIVDIARKERPAAIFIDSTRLRNEALILQDTLNYVGEQVDAIVAYDDASTDRTLEILRGHPKVVLIVTNKAWRKTLRRAALQKVDIADSCCRLHAHD
jgi:hypothetical protein